MLCYGPLVSELGGPRVHGALNPVIETEARISNTTKFTMKRKAGSLIYINWSGGRCTAGRGRGHYCSRTKPATPRRAKPVTPLNIKLSVGRRRLLHTDCKQMSLLAAVSAPNVPLGEGRPSSRRQQQGRR